MQKDCSAIRVIFLDVGSTLVDEDQAHVVRFVKLRPEIEKATGKRPEIIDFMNKMYEIGSKQYNIVYPAMRALGLPDDVEKLKYDPAYEVLYPNVRNGLELLSSKYRIGIIANQRPGLPERLKTLGVYGFIDPELMFGSEDVGMKKPDPEIFLAALKAAGVSPEEAIMVGDRPDNDICPANLLGMRTARIRSGPNAGITDEREEAQPDIDAKNFLEFTEIMMNNRAWGSAD